MPTLSVLDLGLLHEGTTSAQATREILKSAAAAEAYGYRRYWLAEHHMTPGLISASTPLLIGAVAAATSTIRVGAAALQLGHRTPLSIVEDAASLNALHHGRIDIGVGRSRGKFSRPEDPSVRHSAATRRTEASRTDDGLILPLRGASLATEQTERSWATGMRLLHHGINADVQSMSEQLDEIAALSGPGIPGPDETTFRANPGDVDSVEWWLMGATAGTSSELAGQRGMRFAASYHHAPSTTLEAVEAYRRAFRPSAALATPYVSVTASILCADTDQEAERLASGYPDWIASTRRGRGTMPYPSRGSRRAPLSDADLEAIRDRTETQIVGSPHTVSRRLQALARETRCDEIAVVAVGPSLSVQLRTLELVSTMRL